MSNRTPSAESATLKLPFSAWCCLAACFLLSGAASLMDQVVWLRMLSLSFGNTTLATATLLAVFLGGLGGGALLVSRFVDRVSKPLMVYAVFEVAIAGLALLSPSLLGLVDLGYIALYRSLGNHPVLFSLARTVWVGFFLLPPTLLMGATLPLVLRAVTRTAQNVGRSTAILYGLNTFGAVFGTAAAAFWVIPNLGLRGTLGIAATANILAALGAMVLSSRLGRSPSTSIPPGKIGTPREGVWWLALFFAMGATSLAYEVLWTRVLVFHIGSSVYAFSIMLLAVLLGIAVGSLLAAPWADRVGSVLVALAVVEVGIGLSSVTQILLFERFVDILLWIAAANRASSFMGVAVAEVLAGFVVLGVPTLLMGISFPLAVRAYNRRLDELGRDIGRVYGANTLGSVAGSLTAGFLMIPLVGTQNSLLVLGATNAALGVLLGWRYRPNSVRWSWLVPLSILASAYWLTPNSVILSAGMFGGASDNLVYFHEDAQASVTVRRLLDNNEPYLSLELNGVNVAGTSPDLYAVQKMQGHLPLLLAKTPSKVAHIGFGSGGTAWAVSRHPSILDILIVEISPEVLAASDRTFPNINHGVLRDPRVRTEINDGRNFLLANDQIFDAILSDSIHPRYAGNGSLYSLEYFQLAKERLAPGGVVSMWLPMYSLTPHNYAMILEAFRQVFPDMAVWYETSTLNSFTIVTGKTDPVPWYADTLERAFSSPDVTAEFADLGITGASDVLSYLVATGDDLDPWLRDVSPHVDDVPAVEYESGGLLVRNLPWYYTFQKLLELRPEDPPAEYLEVLPEEERRLARDRFRHQGSVMRRHLEALQKLAAQSDLGIDSAQPMP